MPQPSPRLGDAPRDQPAAPAPAAPPAAQPDPFAEVIRAQKEGRAPPPPQPAPPSTQPVDPFKAFAEEAKKREAAAAKSPFGR